MPANALLMDRITFGMFDFASYVEPAADYLSLCSVAVSNSFVFTPFSN